MEPLKIDGIPIGEPALYDLLSLAAPPWQEEVERHHLAPGELAKYISFPPHRLFLPLEKPSRTIPWLPGQLSSQQPLFWLWQEALLLPPAMLKI